MRKFLFLVTLAIVCLGTGTVRAQLLTGFGTSQFNPFDTSTDFQSAWSASFATQTATTLTVTNVPNSGGIAIFATLPTPVDITGNTAFLDLKGALTKIPTSGDQFQLTLYDSSFDSLVYNFTWTSFTSTTSTVTAALDTVDSAGPFNGTVGSWELDVGGVPGDSLSFTFAGLTSAAMAVPEPSTYAFLGIGLAMLVFVHRRKLRQS